MSKRQAVLELNQSVIQMIAGKNTELVGILRDVLSCPHGSDALLTIAASGANHDQIMRGISTCETLTQFTDRVAQQDSKLFAVMRGKQVRKHEPWIAEMCDMIDTHLSA